MRKTLIVGLVAVSLVLAGCATKRPPTTPPASTGSTAGSGPSTSGVEAPQVGTATVDGAGAGGQLGPKGGLLDQRLVYFDYDSSDIKPEGASLIAAHAQWLVKNPGAKVRLEGHTDERGSPEYNIGLGERRAQAVRRALMLQGVPEAQLTTVSYGEERPAAAGSDESAWAQNRRVEIVYLN